VHKLIFILGIDALDYDLVDKLNLNNLKQVEYGKIVIPIDEKKGYPLSPQVWSSFLIGRNTSIGFEKSHNFMEYLIKINLSFKFDLSKGLLRRIRSFYLENFTSSKRFGNLKQKTFLDIMNSKEINVPFYNFDNKTFDVLYLFGNGKLSLAQSIKEIKSIYEKRKRQIVNELENINNSDIVFAYMHTTDVLQHFLFNQIYEIEKHYINLDNYLSVLKRKLEYSYGDVIFIIVSDHGFDFEIGNHSRRGFYSSNVNLIPKPEKITDFYGIILDLVNKSNGLSRS